MTFQQLRLGRAKLICEEFINEGSPKEVNISKSMRETIQNRIATNRVSKVKLKPLITNNDQLFQTNFLRQHTNAVI